MPKDQRERSLSHERSRFSPFPRSSRSKQPLPQNPLEDDNNRKQWEDARCPVCMEHPHNAILLLCSSHEKGCRPFMCDTSYRHSNCFDQFRKSSVESSPEETPNPTSTLPEPSPLISEGGEITLPDPTTILPEIPAKPKLACPLCRGTINGWVVVDTARRFMNVKPRSCACEACEFSGTYKDLRKHARSVHPLVRPADVDPERQHDWRRLERQRDLGDLISTLQSSMGGEERSGEESTLTVEDGGWLTVFFLVRIIGPGRSLNSSSNPRGGPETGNRRSLRMLWGEPEDDNENGEGSSGQSLPRRYFRRRQHRNNGPESQ